MISIKWLNFNFDLNPKKENNKNFSLDVRIKKEFGKIETI
jgi:hypothetical protein